MLSVVFPWAQSQEPHRTNVLHQHFRHALRSLQGEAKCTGCEEGTFCTFVGRYNNTTASRDGPHAACCSRVCQQHIETSYRRTCSSPGETVVPVPGRITPVPLRVPSWTWKTGRRVRPEDCNRVFNTSRGQVTMAPTVPLHL